MLIPLGEGRGSVVGEPLFRDRVSHVSVGVSHPVAWGISKLRRQSLLRLESAAFVVRVQQLRDWLLPSEWADRHQSDRG